MHAEKNYGRSSNNAITFRIQAHVYINVGMLAAIMATTSIVSPLTSSVSLRSWRHVLLVTDGGSVSSSTFSRKSKDIKNEQDSNSFTCGGGSLLGGCVEGLGLFSQT